MTTARILVYGFGEVDSTSDNIELPDVELIRSNNQVDVYRSGVVGWTHFRNCRDNPYNQIDTHINSLIAIRHQIRHVEAVKAKAEEEYRREAERARNLRVGEILGEVGIDRVTEGSAALRLAERIFDLEQETKQ